MTDTATSKMPAACPAATPFRTAINAIASIAAPAMGGADAGEAGARRRPPNFLFGIAAGLGAAALCWWMLRRRFADDTEVFEIAVSQRMHKSDLMFGKFAKEAAETVRLEGEVNAALEEWDTLGDRSEKQERRLFVLDDAVTKLLVRIDSIDASTQEHKARRKELVGILVAVGERLAATNIAAIVSAHKK